MWDIRDEKYLSRCFSFIMLIHHHLINFYIKKDINKLLYLGNVLNHKLITITFDTEYILRDISQIKCRLISRIN
ncbi:hypothetical protein BWI95_04590 [Kosakonia cowanii JCM 10956 = DSM 18146]|uniref:Uncharacterized protein n=1 Tax=Kosakonia cowanii JCM 10956 = DSM 18146 TaxID=1300165 RepID=A0A807LES0_9ENTR|nr:hypothetical protein BWI95_04590 [Kosakonia cowanii JCM 10956 = DSM 18146]